MHAPREELKRRYTTGEYHLEVSLNHLKLFDEEAEAKIRKYPQRFVPAVRFNHHFPFRSSNGSYFSSKKRPRR